MKRNEEDEIQVLGTSPRKCRSSKKLWIGGLVLCAVFLAGYSVWFLSGVETECAVEEATPEMERSVVSPVDSLSRETPSVALFVDSINDVKMQIYALNGLSAGLSFDMPDQGDTAVFLVVQAADIRRDNGGIVGDFVLRGEQLARGKRKSGYCAVLGGQVVLGLETGDEMLDRCVRQKGDFFRQYPLVMNGEIQENQLKGKALRRALARQAGRLYFVASCNRESIYDFAEALADLGFSEALYLVGGSSYGWWREEGKKVHELGRQETEALSLNLNYLVFRRPESH
ncbi:phosphodiester glycosidase family protein [uncultured Parabacteroides sp.]|uniref:phosphodiester glycosidase family protein n=1 Tax=uncultured Parabacteroides sp. TaxID=512312 RepID=UPI00261939C1|nr:phosphodiester glycosidase family protein [uncultured Parabacteroides sp.]